LNAAPNATDGAGDDTTPATASPPACGPTNTPDAAPAATEDVEHAPPLQVPVSDMVPAVGDELTNVQPLAQEPSE
jgi:hypothetical protein